MDNKDYYKVMGVSKDATEKEIKLAYRRLARKYHPDISKEENAEEHFKEVGEAYEVLKDPEKRKVYDQYMRDLEFNHQSRQSTHQNPYEQSNEHYQSGFDFFESLFGQRPFREQQSAGEDIHGTIQVSLEEAFQGSTKEIHLSGGGASDQTLRVKIPAGVKSGSKIRLNGKGHPGLAKGKPGDLYLTIQVDKHRIFDVMGNDIYVTLPVTPWEVALGSTVAVECC